MILAERRGSSALITWIILPVRFESDDSNGKNWVSLSQEMIRRKINYIGFQG